MLIYQTKSLKRNGSVPGECDREEMVRNHPMTIGYGRIKKWMRQICAMEKQGWKAFSKWGIYLRQSLWRSGSASGP